MRNSDFGLFSWDGEIIKDIQKWAQDRNEKLIHYEQTLTTINPMTGQEHTETTVGWMPESFWNSLRISPGPGEELSYRILEEQNDK